MREISLGQGEVALVDDADYEWLNQWKWTPIRPKRGGIYARRTSRCKPFLMHRLILNTPDGMQTDHRNGNGLDNRRANLRVATKAQNQHNQRLQNRPKTSRFKGVHLDPHGAWVAQIKNGGDCLYIGRFASEIEAATAYNLAASKKHGDFARLNTVT